jgi:hypothetical protein
MKFKIDLKYLLVHGLESCRSLKMGRKLNHMYIFHVTCDLTTDLLSFSTII